MKPKELIELIADLPEKPPITTALEAALAERGGGPKKVWYRSQKEHLTGWLGQYDGPGAYDRKTHSGRSAEFVYNHIMCPPMALWLGEAIGLPKPLVQQAADAVLAAGKALPAQNGALRAVIPWALIEAKLVSIHQQKRQTFEKPPTMNLKERLFSSKPLQRGGILSKSK